MSEFAHSVSLVVILFLVMKALILATVNVVSVLRSVKSFVSVGDTRTRIPGNLSFIPKTTPRTIAATITSNAKITRIV